MSSNMNSKLLGVLFLFLTIGLLVLSSIIIQMIAVDDGFLKPFIFSYFNYSFLILLFPFYYTKIWVSKKCKKEAPITNTVKEEILSNNENETINNKESNPTVNYNEERTLTIDKEQKFLNEQTIDEDNNQKINLRLEYNKKFHLFCIILMLLWYFGNCFYNLSIMTTSISSTNTISNSSIIFIFAIKIGFLKSKCSKYKVIGLILIIVSLIGVFWIDSDIRNNRDQVSISGDIFAIVGALFYSVFALYLKYLYKKYGDNLNIIEIFAYIGLYTLLIIPVILVIMHFTHLEVFTFPNKKQFLIIFINSFIGSMISDVFQNYSNVLLSPHVVSFGLTLTIPVSYFYDVFEKKVRFDYRFIIVSFIIIIAFSFILYEKLTKKKKILNNQSNLN